MQLFLGANGHFFETALIDIINNKISYYKTRDPLPNTVQAISPSPEFLSLDIVLTVISLLVAIFASSLLFVVFWLIKRLNLLRFVSSRLAEISILNSKYKAQIYRLIVKLMQFKFSLQHTKNMHTKTNGSSQHQDVNTYDKYQQGDKHNSLMLERRTAHLVHAITSDFIEGSNITKDDLGYDSVWQTPLEERVLGLKLIAETLEKNKPSVEAHKVNKGSFTPTKQAANSIKQPQHTPICNLVEVIQSIISRSDYLANQNSQENRLTINWTPPENHGEYWATLPFNLIVSILQKYLNQLIERNRFTKGFRINIFLNQYANEHFICVTDNGKGIPHKINSMLIPKSTGFIANPMAMQIIDIVSAQAKLAPFNGHVSVVSAMGFSTKTIIKLPRPEIGKPRYNQKNVSLEQHQVRRKVKTACIEEEQVKYSTVVQNNTVVLNPNMPALLIKSEGLSQQDRAFLVMLEKTMEAHFSMSDFKRPNAASNLAMTEKTLTLKLKKYYGIGFSSLLQQYRLNEAIALMQKGYSVTRTAYDVGFSSPSYFTACFKAEYGCTPTQWQKQAC